MKSLNEWKVDSFAQEHKIDEDLRMALHQLMGKDQITVDTQLRSKLKDEITRIMKIYPDVNKIELLKMIISVAGSVMMDSNTHTMSITNFAKGLGDTNEEI